MPNYGNIKHYVSEAGTDLILDCGVAIGTVQFQAIKYLKPDGTTEGTWTGSLFSSYSLIAAAIGTYFVKYTTTTASFDTPGDWKFQAHIGAIDGTWYGETVEMTIFDSFE